MNFIPNLNLIRNGARAFALYVYNAFRAIEAKFPIRGNDYGSPLPASVINWVGSPVLPHEIIPWDAVPASAFAGSAFVNCLDIYRDGICQYRDDDSLFFGPGNVLHRGLFKTQTCNDDDSWVHALAASLVIPDECPVSPGTPTGLEADMWYFVYWKLDVAGEGPEYRISKVPPVRCAGRGPEHPVYEKLRFVGSFRTRTDGIIAPFHRYHNGNVFWREILVGPGQPPTYDLDPAGGGISIPVDVSAHVPPSADAAFVSATCDVNNEMWIRMTGDLVEPAGYALQNQTGTKDRRLHAWMEVGVNQPDGLTGLPSAGTHVDVNDGGSISNSFEVVGYHEALL